MPMSSWLIMSASTMALASSTSRWPFGPEDMEVGRKNKLPLVMTIDAAGRFTPEVTPWAGLFVKGGVHLRIQPLN